MNCRIRTVSQSLEQYISTIKLAACKAQRPKKDILSERLSMFHFFHTTPMSGEIEAISPAKINQRVLERVKEVQGFINGRFIETKICIHSRASLPKAGAGPVGPCLGLCVFSIIIVFLVLLRLLVYESYGSLFLFDLDQWTSK